MNQRILITGSNGFIGSHLVKFFCKQNDKVIGIDRLISYSLSSDHWNNYKYFPLDLPDPVLIDKLLEWKPDILIHAAGNSSISHSVINPLEDFYGSVVVFFNLLEAVRKASPETKIINLSSAAVYGNPESLPVTESQAVKPISPYGFHKLLCENISREFFLLYKMNICSVRIFSAYGPGLRRQVVWDIVKKAFHDPVIHLSGTGQESRDFIFVDDIVKAISIIASRGTFVSEVYNVASGIEMTIKDLSKLVVGFVGVSKEIEFSGQQRPGDPLYWKADIQRIESLGFTPSVTVEEGINQFVAWAINELNQEQRRSA